MNQADLLALTQLIESGKIAPVIDRAYPLSKTPEAIAYREQRHARGKVIITLFSATADRGAAAAKAAGKGELRGQTLHGSSGAAEGHVNGRMIARRTGANPGLLRKRILLTG